MKRVLLLVALCVATSASFAQKKVVNQAQNTAKGNNADYAEARTLIQGALENEETKNDPRTWYIAGFIEDQQFSAERTKQMLGNQPNEPVMYSALMSILPYFKKSYELDQTPDERGRVRPRHTKDIKSILGANHVYYINSGAYFFENKEYQKAYDSFEQFLEISNMPMFEGEAVAARDSNFMTVQFYAAVAATQLNDPQKAISALERAKDTDFRANDIYQYLAYEYEQLKDTVNWEKVLEEGMGKFPEEKYYLMVLINNYIYSNRNDQAIEYLNKAIASDANNAQLYDVLGRVYETGLQDVANSEKYFLKALEIDPNYTEALSNLGRVYYNQGITTQDNANKLNDNKLYQEETVKAKECFQKALPYFEKARQLNPEGREILVALRGIYYNLNMGKEFEEIEAAMGM